MLGLLLLVLTPARGSSAVPPSAAACAGPESVSAPLRFEANVRDPVFAALLGLLNGNRFGCLDGATLANEVRRSARSSLLPFSSLRRLVRRASATPGAAHVTLDLDAQLKTPIPYRILWIYRPGSIWVDAALELAEWPRGEVTLEDDAHAPAHLGDLHLFRFDQGRGGADIDALFDHLLGGRLDDMTVDGLATFAVDGRRWGVVFGATPKGVRQIGALDFTSDEIAFPMSKRLWAIARQLRSTLETLDAARGGKRVEGSGSR
jgi:hypothetical protein